MKKFLAYKLRRWAQDLDPQPLTLELRQVVRPVKELNGLVGTPVYFWRNGSNSFSVYPWPDRDWRICIRDQAQLITGVNRP